MSYQIYTLIDITQTGKNRGRHDAGKEVDQQNNWMTFQNCAMLRTNMEFSQVTVKEDIVDQYMFGKQFDGKQKIWSVTATPDRPDAVTIDMLKDDFDMIPMINQLDESINQHNDMFSTKNDETCNILFINSSDN